MKAVWAILAMTTIWLTINSSKINTCNDNQKQVDDTIERMIGELEREEEKKKKSKSFDDAFAEARSKYGADSEFFWKGEIYSTQYASEINNTITTQNVAYSNGWVLNSDDLDDYCATNDRDECGICGGSGAMWYADRDGDGLGDIETTFSGCTEPITQNRR